MANVRRTAGDRKTNLYTSAAPAAKYDILVSVFNPRPDQQNVQWDVRAAMEGILIFFFCVINFVSRFELTTVTFPPFKLLQPIFGRLSMI